MIQIYRNQNQYINNFTIYGERNSGTKFLEQCIKQQFDLDLTYFYGFKHFFGWTKPEVITYRGKHTLFFGIVRNPYQWIMSMYGHPHNIPKNNITSFDALISNEWYSINYHNQEIMTDRNFNSNIKSPTRYNNIFHMRATKYQYLIEIMPVICQNYVLLSYDSFIKNHNNYLNIIQNRFDLKRTGIPPNIINKPPKILTDYRKQKINENLNWEIEESLGYYKSDTLK